MTGLAHHARLVLHDWARQPDPDPVQQRWKVLYRDAMIEAAGRTGLLEGDELAQWHAATGHDSWLAPDVDAARVGAHLEELLDELSPLTHEPRPQALAAGTRFNNALTTLHRSGAISDQDHADWRARALRAQAPWLDDADFRAITGMSGAVAIGIPPTTEEERLADAAMAARHEPPVDRRLVRLVPVRPAERHDGTAVTALVLRAACLDVHFHHVGVRQGDSGMGDRHAAFRSAVGELSPPTISDDLGTDYAPDGDGPGSAHGTGGAPDPDRPLVITGTWRYRPAVPPEAAWLTAGGGVRFRCSLE